MGSVSDGSLLDMIVNDSQDSGESRFAFPTINP